MTRRVWARLADWCCPARVWRDLGHPRRPHIADRLLRRPWQ